MAALVAVAAVLLSGYLFRGKVVALFRGQPGPTFARDVAPIIHGRCASCHHPGEAAPFSLLTYDDVRQRSRQIVEVTHKGLMPPWLPKPGHGDFIGARRLTPSELQTLKAWAEQGAPSGNEADIPKPPRFAEHWHAGKPDLVLETPEYTLTGDQRDVFRNFVVPINLEAPRWVQSIELLPTNPRVTHHARLGVDSSNESTRREAEDPQPGYDGMAWGQDPDGQLVIWAPGMVASPPPPDVAWRLYPRSSLVLHAHLQPSGKPEKVKFRIGLRFTSIPPKLRPAVLRIGSTDIDIPVGARDHTVMDQFLLPIDVDVHTIFPHAHSLCRDVHVVAERPDGGIEQLIHIEQFDENWHDNYRYRQPVRLPRGTRLHSKFKYDNSADNPRNRSRPPRRVVYGSNASDEMADVYLQVTAAAPDQRAALMEEYKRYELNARLTGHRRALELSPNDPWHLEGLAACYVAQGALDQAISTLELRIQTGPKAVFPVTSLGMALLARGEPILAEEKLRLAIEQDREYPLAWYGLGKSLAAQQQLRKAEQALRTAAELAPGFLDAAINLADLQMVRGDLDGARDSCILAISTSPDNSAVYLKMADILVRQKKYADALTQFKMAHHYSPYLHPPKVLLAVACLNYGAADEGHKLLREARAEAPDHPVPALMLGQLARQQQQSQAAREHLAAAAKLPMPDNWPMSHKKRYQMLLHSERLQLSQQLQDRDLALDAVAQLIQCDPANQQLRKLQTELQAGKQP